MNEYTNIEIKRNVSQDFFNDNKLKNINIIEMEMKELDRMFLILKSYVAMEYCLACFTNIATIWLKEDGNKCKFNLNIAGDP